MRKSKTKIQWCIFLISILSILGYNTQDVLAKVAKDNSYDGIWKDGARTLPSGINIRATLDASMLFIETTTQRSDITIRVSQGSEVVYEQTIPAAEAKNIAINLDELSNGSYSLDLTNQWGDYLHGAFDIQK